jgi:hypothetical protein
VLAALGGDRARSLVVRLMEETGQYEDTRELYADACRALDEHETRRELVRELDGLKRGDGAERERLERVYARLRAMKIEGGDADASPPGSGAPQGRATSREDTATGERVPTRREDPARVS